MALQVEPELGAVAEVAAEAHRRVGADQAPAVQNLRDPGGHYLATAHTQSHFQTAFFMPELADNNSFEQWQLDGAKDATARALETARRMLDAYEPPPLDPAVDEALQAFIREREAVLPDQME